MVKALIVEDSQTAAEGLKQILSLLDIEAQVALGPRPAMTLLKEMTPNVVFLDVNMPGVTGFDVQGYLQREPRLKDVPVIFVSSEDQAETLNRARQAGAKAFVLKPATLESIEAALKLAGLEAKDR
ncbi:MAG: response regulator [Chloroflexi bacterium]|nr:response regulator [Chloroflexota bacterium]